MNQKMVVELINRKLLEGNPDPSGHKTLKFDVTTPDVISQQPLTNAKVNMTPDTYLGLDRTSPSGKQMKNQQLPDPNVPQMVTYQ